MSANLKRITLKELKPIIEYYQAQFPGWRIVRGDTLVREVPPVLQGVTFERLSYGVYRPIGHIRVLVAPEPFWGFDLPQHLNVKVRTVDRREHPRMRGQVVEAMRAEFQPPMDRPLVAEEVLDLFESKAVPTAAQAYSLAPLNAYLGHLERAKTWCERWKELIAKLGLPPGDSDQDRLAYINQLENWLQAGTAHVELEEVLERERRKWKLA
jgi:hypothetical protein